MSEGGHHGILQRIAILEAVLALSLSGCGERETASTSAALTNLLADTSVTRIAFPQDSAPSFTGIQDADITPDGRHIIVVGRTSPYIHVLDRSGRSRAAFLDSTVRTIESLPPYAVASRDSQLLVMDGGFRLFDLDGRILSTVGRAGILPFEAVPGCGAEWVIYGYGGKAGLPGRDEEWIQRLEFDSAGIKSRLRLYSDSAAPQRLGFGRPYNVARGDDEFVVLHEHGIPPRLLRWSCGRLTPRTAPENTALAPVSQAPDPEAGRNVRAITVSGTSAVPVGIALLADGVLTTSLRAPAMTADSVAVETQFQLITGDIVYTAVVPGSYRLRSARYGQEILLVSDLPTSHVLLVPEVALLAAIRSGRARSASDAN